MFGSGRSGVRRYVDVMGFKNTEVGEGVVVKASFSKSCEVTGAVWKENDTLPAPKLVRKTGLDSQSFSLQPLHTEKRRLPSRPEACRDTCLGLSLSLGRGLGDGELVFARFARSISKKLALSLIGVKMSSPLSSRFTTFCAWLFI